MSDDGMQDDLLRDLFAEGDEPAAPLDGPALLAVRRRGRTAGAVAAGVGVLALAAVGMSLWRGPSSVETGELRPRGDEAVSLELQAIVEGPDGARRAWVPTAPPIGPEESVVFVAIASRPGFLCLDERDEDWVPLLPDGASWEVVAGAPSALQSGGAPMAFRTDRGPGAREYRATWSSDPQCAGAKTEATLELVWSP